MTSELSYIIDTLFIIFSFVLIIFMVPGFAMLEAGIVRTKNVTSVLMMNTMIYAFGSFSFIFVGYKKKRKHSHRNLFNINYS